MRELWIAITTTALLAGCATPDPPRPSVEVEPPATAQDAAATTEPDEPDDRSLAEVWGLTGEPHEGDTRQVWFGDMAQLEAYSVWPPSQGDDSDPDAEPQRRPLSDDAMLDSPLPSTVTPDLDRAIPPPQWLRMFIPTDRPAESVDAVVNGVRRYTLDTGALPVQLADLLSHVDRQGRRCLDRFPVNEFGRQYEYGLLPDGGAAVFDPGRGSGETAKQDWTFGTDLPGRIHRMCQWVTDLHGTRLRRDLRAWFAEHGTLPTHLAQLREGPQPWAGYWDDVDGYGRPWHYVPHDDGTFELISYGFDGRPGGEDGTRDADWTKPSGRELWVAPGLHPRTRYGTGTLR